MALSIILPTKIGGVEKVFRIKAPADPDADLAHQAIPHFTTDIYIRHVGPELTQSRTSFRDLPRQNISGETFAGLFVYGWGKWPIQLTAKLQSGVWSYPESGKAGDFG